MADNKSFDRPFDRLIRINYNPWDNGPIATPDEVAEAEPIEPVRNGIITFRGGANYWSSASSHAVLASYIRASARKRWNLRGDGSPRDVPFSVPKTRRCTQSLGIYCNQSHEVPEEEVYVYATDVLGMVSNVTEKVVEKVVVVESGYITSAEKYEALSFALTRELRLTEQELSNAYLSDDAEYALRLTGRIATIREVMTDLGATEMHGSPEWMLVHVEVLPSEAPQMEMFDALRE